jgi:hypothetical protein
MLPFPRAIGASLLAAVAISACSAGPAGPLVKPPPFNPPGQTRCGIVKSAERPLIVGWPSADRQALESKVRSGVVLVRYQGCEMDVLSRCSVSATYGYHGATRDHDRTTIKNIDELYANLPVGAAKLEGTLERAGQLTVDMDFVGRYESERPSVRVDELHGECEGATHFVYALSVGAFEFYAGAHAKVGGSAGIGGAGLGSTSQASTDDTVSYGDPAACAKATTTDKVPPEGCGALIRVEVVPLASAKTTSTEATAFPTAPPPSFAAPPSGSSCRVLRPAPRGLDLSASEEAQQLFDDAVRLMLASSYRDACPKLERSYRLTGDMGTLMKLAVCEHKDGSFGQAHDDYETVCALARASRDSSMEAWARKGMEATTPLPVPP